MTAYLAARAHEEPGIKFSAETLSAAKTIASRTFQSGAFSGQQIRLVELADSDLGIIRTDRVWVKAAHHKGKWTPLGDAV